MGFLLRAGAEIDSQDGKSGRTPLHHAVETNQRALVEVLLGRGASVNQQSYSGCTALHVATGRSLMDIVGLLVKFGADTSIKNIYLESSADNQVRDESLDFCGERCMKGLIKKTLICKQKNIHITTQKKQFNVWQPVKGQFCCGER